MQRIATSKQEINEHNNKSLVHPIIVIKVNLSSYQASICEAEDIVTKNNGSVTQQRPCVTSRYKVRGQLESSIIEAKHGRPIDI